MSEATPLTKSQVDGPSSSPVLDFVQSEHGMSIITAVQALPWFFGYCCWATFSAGLMVAALSPFAYNLSHLIQVPIILAMQAYLLHKYHGMAQTGDKLPLMLQCIAAVLMLWFPLKDFLDTELTKGLLKEEIHPPGWPNFSERPVVAITNGAGMAITIVASLVAAKVVKIPTQNDQTV